MDALPDNQIDSVRQLKVFKNHDVNDRHATTQSNSQKAKKKEKRASKNANK